MSTGRKASGAAELITPTSSSDRVEVAFARGRQALDDFARARGISIAEARRKLEAASHAGRRKSRAAACL